MRTRHALIPFTILLLTLPAFAGSEVMKVPPGTKLEKATFAGGCFWHVEHTFRRVKGVVATTVGYTGGTVKSPSYEQVSTGETGHAESVSVEYDPSKISYGDLLKVFFGAIDPTTLNRQGPDVGNEYRSAVFYHDEGQKAQAKAMIEKLAADPKYKGKKIVTEVTPAQAFYAAEDYHQQYFEKHPLKAIWFGESPR